MNKVIFFGNGPLADFTLAVLQQHCEIIFHARTKDDLVTAVSLKRQHPDAFGILASFGVMIKSDVLEAFAPEVSSTSIPLNCPIIVALHQSSPPFSLATPILAILLCASSRPWTPARFITKLLSLTFH